MNNAITNLVKYVSDIDYLFQSGVYFTEYEIQQLRTASNKINNIYKSLQLQKKLGLEDIQEV